MENLLFNAMLAVATPEEPATWFVCLLGVGVVFVGLICIIGILYLMNFLISAMEGKKAKPANTPATPAVSATAQTASAPIENRQEIIAAVCAAVAEENGTDISGIRVISFKKL